VESAFGTFEAGSVVGGRWELTTLLRASSIGTIWSARERDGHRRVVFKLVDPTAPRRIAASNAASARATAAIRHPNVLRLLDVRTHRGQVLIVAEHVAGRTLAEVPAERPLELARGLADGLAAMHAHRVAHLDLRPAKVLVGEDGAPRLVDFGSGRVRAGLPADGGTDDRMTWDAPEQIIERAHGPAADIYRLGFTLWATAGGDLSSLGTNAPAQAAHRIEHDLPRLDHRTDLPQRFVDAVAAATRRGPERRPSARRLAAILEGDDTAIG
jgi:eukaryotic-like serine/threonine-protein kinase